VTLMMTGCATTAHDVTLTKGEGKGGFAHLETAPEGALVSKRVLGDGAPGGDARAGMHGTVLAT